MTPAEIRKLQSLAEQGKARDLARFASALRHHEGLVRQIAEIQADGHRYSLAAGNNFSVIARWQSWATHETKRLEAEAQQALLGTEEIRLLAVKSSAKVNALEILMEKSLGPKAVMLGYFFPFLLLHKILILSDL